MSNKPFQTLRDGAIKATIWQNTNEKGDFYSVEISRGYQDEAKQWHKTNSFAGTELLRVAELSRRAYELILSLKSSTRGDAENATGGVQ